MSDEREVGYTESSSKLFGTLEIQGVGTYYTFVSQSSTRKVWVLTEQNIFDEKSSVNKDKALVAILRIFNTGRMEGAGKTYLLTRLLDSINVMIGRAAESGETSVGFSVSSEYSDNTSFIRYKTLFVGGRYSTLDMSYGGFNLSLAEYHRKFPFNVPRSMLPVQDDKMKAAMIAGLGVRTFALLKRQRGSALDWYDKKRYVLVDSNDKFKEMMLAFLRDVQHAADKGQSVLVALDTETTGLNMLKLKPDNPFRDYVVAIPFGWKTDEAYLICTEMYYFGNVDREEVYPLFDKLFSRNVDYTYQDIELDYAGEHFSFNRKNILLVGANVSFDERAFKSEGASVFFDEDIQLMHYILATDWVQGKNSLKYMTHRYLGDETLELEDLFGPQHKDKFRYLSDPELALVYGGADADYPRVLWKKLRRLLPNNLYYLYKKYDITTLYRTAMATWNGMWVDTKGVKEQGDKVLQDLETLKNFIYKYAYAANRNNIAEKMEKLSALLGMDSASDIKDLGERDGMYRYPFTPANHKNLLFNILGYPVVKMSEKSQTPALDKFVLKKLAERKRESPVEFLLEDIPSASDPSAPLVSKDEFNSDLYPLARVFQTYAKINKEYTAYYKPIMQNDLEGRMFYTFSMQRAATRRILSAGQTMKGSLKKLVIAPPGKLFMCFDASQIEYRHMASLAYVQTKALLKAEHPDDWEKRLAESGIARIVKMMHGEEADYHIETASMMTGLPQYMIDHDTRKMYKSIGFGIPYGLGDQSMCESLFGKITKENMEKTRKTLSDYKARQFEIIRLLETVRDSAFVPAKIPDEFREMLGTGETHVGIVRNFVGFYRLFILENLTRARTGRIRRQAGNCIIQGGAAELFRRMVYNFYIGCTNAGIEDMVQMEMFVHDEVDTVIDDSIDVCKLLSVIQNSCTLRYEDHIPYYVGIGFGHDWHDAKDDAAELPVIMVNRLIKAYDSGRFSIPNDGQQPDNLLKLKRHYLCDRVGEELHKLIPEIGPGFKWDDKAVDYIANNFVNYTVRSYLSTFLTKEDKKSYSKKNPPPLKLQLERWQEARELYGFDKSFLSETFVDARKELREIVLDDAPDMSEEIGVTLDFDQDDLKIELLSNEDEEEARRAEAENSSWFGEDNLFDYSVSQDEIAEYDVTEGYRYLDSSEREEDNLELNATPTSAYDVFISKKYVRQKIFSMTLDNTKFSVMLTDTPYSNKVREFAKEVKSALGTGSGCLVFIGSSVLKAENIDCTEEKLDKLDKILCGVVDTKE